MTSDATRDIQAFLCEQVVPAGGSRHGIVIGIQQYHDARLDLRCAAADARAMYGLMTDPDCGMFPKDNVRLLLDDEATKENIWRALSSLRRAVGENDTVWVYYAGHAAPEGSNLYWVTYDADVDDLYGTGLSNDQIAKALDDIRASRLLVLLDCCHAAATAVQKNPTRAVLTAEEVFACYKGKGRIRLSSSDGKERSVELGDVGHGAFTYFLEKGLRGEADADGDGVVTADELWRYLQTKVADASQRVGNRQTPIFSGEMTHELCLTLNPVALSRKKQINAAIVALIGLGEDRLATEEAELCLAILRRGPIGSAEANIVAEFDSLLSGHTRTATFKRLIQAARNAKSVTVAPPSAVVPVPAPAHPSVASAEALRPTAQCHAPGVTGLPVVPSHSYTPPPKPIPTTAILRVTSDSPGAEVLVDSRVVGRTPLLHPLDLGGKPQRQVEVVVRKDGYQSKATIVQLRGGATSDWTNVTLAPLKPTDLPDPTAVQVKEIVVGPLVVEIEPVAHHEMCIGDLPPLATDLMQCAGTLEGLTRTIAGLRNESHPSLAMAKATIAQARQQHDRLRGDLEEYGKAIPGYVRRRIDDELRRNPSHPVSGLVALAKDSPQDVVLRYLYGLRHMEHARRVVEQAEGSFQHARQAKIDELAIQAEQLRVELEPRMEHDFVEIMAGVFAKVGPSGQFPLESWMKLEPLLAQRPYPWDRRALLAKAEDLFRDWPDHEAWRQAREGGTRQAYEDYLRNAPNSCHSAEARAELARLAKADEQEDDRQWRVVGAGKTAAACAGYLSNRPRGRHAAAVRYFQALWTRQERDMAAEKLLQKVDQLLADCGVVEAASVLRQAMQRPEYQGCLSLLARWAELGRRASRRTFQKFVYKGAFAGHAGWVRGVQITPNGEQAVSAGQDHQLLLWDLGSGLCRAVLMGHTRAVLSVTVDVDGRRAVSGSEDSSVRVWDLESHKCVGVLIGHREAVTGARLLADGRHVLSCSDDSTVRLWDLESGACLKTLSGHHRGGVTAVAMITTGQCVSAGQDDTLVLWDLQSGACVKSIHCDSDGVNDVAVSSDGLLAATAGSDNTARVWNLQTGQCVKVLRGHASRVLTVSFLSDGDRLLTSGRDGTVRLWDVAASRCVRTMKGHLDEVTDLSVAADDAWAISSSYDQSLRVWDIGTGECRSVLGSAVGRVTAIGPGGPRAMLAGTDKGEVCMLPASGGGCPRVLGVHPASILCAAANADGTRAVTIGRDRVMRLWDLNTGQLVKVMEGDCGEPVAVGFAAKGDSAMLLGREGGLTHWDLASGKGKPICPATEATLSCGMFVTEANRVVGGTTSGLLLLWELSSGRFVGRAKVAGAAIRAVALDCTGRRALVAAGQELKLIDLEARNSRALAGHDGPVLCVTFASDGQLAVTGGQDQTVRIWDVASGTCLVSSAANGGAILAVASGLDGGTVAGACADGAVALWESQWDYDFAP